MTKKTELTRELARNIALALNANIFDRQNSSNPKLNAQANLSGKTHYVDDDALGFFHSRIISTREIDHGLVFLLIESVAADHQNRSRGFRFVAFDLFGTVLNERPSLTSGLCRTSSQAEKQMWAWADEFDTLVHYKHAMTERADQMKHDAAFMAKQARAIKI